MSLICLVLTFASSSVAQSDRIPTLFLNLVNKSIRGTLEAESAKYSLPASLQLKGVRLLDPRGNVVARIQSASFDVAVTELLAGRIAIKDLTISRPSMKLVRKNGELNLLNALEARKASDGKPPNLEVHIDGIRVSNGTFRYVESDVVAIDAGPFSARASVHIDLLQNDVVVDVNRFAANAGSVSLRDLDVPLRNFRVRSARFQNNAIRIFGATTDVLQASTLSADGNIDFKGEGRYSLNGRATTAAKNWPARLSPLPFDTPRIDARVSMRGPLAEPAISVDGEFGAFDAFGYSARRGRANVLIGASSVRINNAALTLKSSSKNASSINASGTYRYADGFLNLSLNTPGFSLREAMGPAELAKPPRGWIRGSAKLSGVVTPSYQLKIMPKLRVSAFSGFGVVAPVTQVLGRIDLSESQVALDTRLVSKKSRITLKGPVNLEKRRVDFNIDATSDEVRTFIPDFPEELLLGQTKTRGRVEGPYDNIVVALDAEVSKGDAYGVPFKNVSARVNASAKETRISKIVASLAEGSLTGDLKIDTRGQSTLDGNFIIENNQLAKLRVLEDKSQALPVVGTIEKATLNITGPASDPDVLFEGGSGPLVAADEKLGRLTFAGRTNKRRLSLTRLALTGGIAEGAGVIEIGFDDKSLRGRFDFSTLSLNKITALKKSVEGDAKVELLVGGTTDAPLIEGDVDAKSWSAKGVPLGDGRLKLRFLPEAEPFKKDGNFVVTATGRFKSDESAFELRASYALARERLNAELTLTRLELSAFNGLHKDIPKTEGKAVGQAKISGALDNPRVSFELLSADVALVKNEKEKRALGALKIEGRLIDQELELKLCKGPYRGLDKCARGEHVKLAAQGKIDLKKEFLDVDFDADVQQSHIEDYVNALSAIGGGADVAANIKGKVYWRFADKAPSINSKINLAALTLRVDGVPTVDLAAPAQIALNNSGVTFVDALRFEGDNGDGELTGRVSDEEIDLRLKGNIGLPLLKLYTDELTTASGKVKTNLTLKGKLAAVEVSGTLVPEVGARVGLRSLRQTLSFTGGAIAFEYDINTGEQKVSIPDAKPLSATLGQGNISLEGDMRLRYLSETKKFKVSRWNLQATIDDVLYRERTMWLKTSAQLSLKSDSGLPRLSGRVDIDEGMLRSEFGMNNFIVAPLPGPPSAPLDERLAQFDLGALELDLRVFVQEFRGRAEVLASPLNVVVAGDVALHGSARVPKLEGALEVLDGEFVFPHARFDVAAARFEWPKGRAGFVPEISINAISELPAQGTCELDVPIELTLEGENLDRLTFVLSANEASHAHSRTELLWAVLGNVPLPACSLNNSEGGADLSVAWRALSSTFSGQVSRELESLLQKRVGGRLQINPFFDGERLATDVKWQLGRRIQLEGETGLLASTEFVDGGESIPVAGADVRVRLLLWDPLPPGRAFFLEGEFSSRNIDGAWGETQLQSRLKWRIFED